MTTKIPSPCVLFLSEKEAKVLASILAKVGGHPGGPRGIVDKMFDYLRSISKTYKEDALDHRFYLPDKWENYDSLKDTPI